MKTPDRPTSLQSLLRRHPALSRLAQESARRGALLSRVREALPEAARTHLQAASLEGTHLHLTVDAAAWAGRLRLMAPSLQGDLAGHYGIACEKITVCVRPGTASR